MGLIRSAGPWAFFSGALAVLLLSLATYAYLRHSKLNGLIVDLQSKRSETAELAAKELGQMGSDTVRYLIPVIKTMDSESRSYAAKALREIDSAVPALLKLLQNEDVVVRVAAVEVLGKIGSVATDSVPALIEALKDENSTVRNSVKIALGEIRDPRAIEPLIETFKDRSYSVVVIGDPAVESLAKIGTPALPSLRTALRDPEPIVRESCARVLGKMGAAAKDSVPELIVALNDADERVNTSAKFALGDIGDERAVEPLIQALSGESSTEGATVIALGRIGEAAVDPLRAKLKAPRDKIRILAVAALGRIGPRASAAVPDLISLIKDPAHDVRSQVIVALGRIQDYRAVPFLIALINEDRHVEGAIAALGEIGPSAKEALPLFIELSWNENDSYRTGAINARKKISPESMSEIILDEQEYARLGSVISKVEVLDPTRAEDSPEIRVTFAWMLRDRKPGDICSIVFIDKRYKSDVPQDPFDGGYEDKFNAGHSTQLSDTLLNFSRYSQGTFDWGVKVTACRDAGQRCEKTGSCVGRVFRSNIGTFSLD